MKKYILIALILLLCLNVFACKGKNDINPDNPTIDLSQMYFFDNILFKPLYKYNILTGSYTPVCTDPLCEHKRDVDPTCKFAGCEMVKMHGEWVYFTKSSLVSTGDASNPMAHRSILCAYNYATAEYKELYVAKDGMFQIRLEYYDGYIFFYMNVLNDEGETEYELSRVNVDTKKVESLCTVPIAHDAMAGGELVFSDGINTIFKTDIYYQNRVDLVEVPKVANLYSYTDGKYAYYTSIESIPESANELAVTKNEFFRVDIGTGETEKIADTQGHLGVIKIIGGYIYYRGIIGSEPDTYTYIDEYENEQEVVINNVLRIKFDGGEPELFYENSENKGVFINQIDIAGKYFIGWDYKNPAEKVVFDTESGEWVRGL